MEQYNLEEDGVIESLIDALHTSTSNSVSVDILVNCFSINENLLDGFSDNELVIEVESQIDSGDDLSDLIEWLEDCDRTELEDFDFDLLDEL